MQFVGIVEAFVRVCFEAFGDELVDIFGNGERHAAWNGVAVIEDGFEYGHWGIAFEGQGIGEGEVEDCAE